MRTGSSSPDRVNISADIDQLENHIKLNNRRPDQSYALMLRSNAYMAWRNVRVSKRQKGIIKVLPRLYALPSQLA